MEPRTRSVVTPDGRALNTFTWDGPPERMVVFESGLGLAGRYWAPVARLLTDSVTAVAYDRSGLGASTEDHRPRTLDRLAGDLAHVARTAPPWHEARTILVGHSWGGPIARRAWELLPADRRPSGLILVDPSDEELELRASPLAGALDHVQSAALPLLARTGVLRWGMTRSLNGLLEGEDLRSLVAASTSPAAVRAAAEENRHFRQGLKQLRDQDEHPDVPVSVISGTRSTLANLRGPMNRAHRRSLARYRDPRWLAAPRSAHMVPLTDPEVVADEVTRMFQKS